MRKGTLILVMAMMVVLGGAPGAAACTCSVPSMVDSWMESSLIFAGRVTQLTPMTSGSLSGFTVVEFEAAKFWKGATDSGSILLLNPSNEGLCGYHFVLDQEYLVYAETSANNEGWQRTSICSRTSGWLEDHPDVSFLDEVTSVEEKSWTALKKLFTD